MIETHKILSGRYDIEIECSL